MSWLEPLPAFAAADLEAIPIHIVDRHADSPLDSVPDAVAAPARAAGWSPRSNGPFVARGADGRLDALLVGIDRRPWPKYGPQFPMGELPIQLASNPPTGRNAPVAWSLHGLADSMETEAVALGWLLGSYRYRAPAGDDAQPAAPAALRTPEGIDANRVLAIGEAVWLARRLIDSPANLLPPSALAAAVEEVAGRHGADVSTLVGDALLKENWPLVHAVGRASAELPRVVDLRWGAEDAPSVTLVGKGVVFDSGGLDLKPARFMRYMKKDMGGAAAALAAAHAIMSLRLPVRLRLLVPIVENAVSGAAYRPGDALPSRKGLTVEIGDTDAEGRLILADALAEADSEAPDLLVDYATLTGAARVALGPDLPAYFTEDDDLAARFETAARSARDPVWRLPLWDPYGRSLRSPVADLCSTGLAGKAGAVTAALFLRSFVESAKAWIHVDLYAWNDAAAPAKRVGGECQAARATLALVESLHPRSS